MPRKKGILALAAAYSHPTRVRILTAMNAPVRRYSPKQLAQEWGEDIDLIAYDFRELVAFELLEIVEEISRGGSIEHVHEATQTAVAWDEDWKAIPPVFKQHIASLTLRLAVEAIGASIGDGRFESRDDTVLAQDTIRVDEQGAAEALKILAMTVEALMSVADRAATRLAEDDDDGLLISYLTIGYEGALRPL